MVGRAEGHTRMRVVKRQADASDGAGAGGDEGPADTSAAGDGPAESTSDEPTSSPESTPSTDGESSSPTSESTSSETTSSETSSDEPSSSEDPTTSSSSTEESSGAPADSSSTSSSSSSEVDSSTSSTSSSSTAEESSTSSAEESSSSSSSSSEDSSSSSSEDTSSSSSSEDSSSSSSSSDEESTSTTVVSVTESGGSVDVSTSSLTISDGGANDSSNDSGGSGGLSDTARNGIIGGCSAAGALLVLGLLAWLLKRHYRSKRSDYTPGQDEIRWPEASEPADLFPAAATRVGGHGLGRDNSMRSVASGPTTTGYGGADSSGASTGQHLMESTNGHSHAPSSNYAGFGAGAAGAGLAMPPYSTAAESEYGGAGPYSNDYHYNNGGQPSYYGGHQSAEYGDFGGINNGTGYDGLYAYGGQQQQQPDDFGMAQGYPSGGAGLGASAGPQRVSTAYSGIDDDTGSVVDRRDSVASSGGGGRLGVVNA